MGETAQRPAIMTCPLCGAVSREKYSLPAAKLRRALAAYYDEVLPPELLIVDSAIYRCSTCTLEHAQTLIPGDKTFYEWITGHRTYYPSERWEWRVVRDQLAMESRPFSLLEIGCGDGRFLEQMRDLPSIKVTGLDPTPSSAERCRAKHLNVYAETIDEHLRRVPVNDVRFDVVAAFHCLEHVADPAGLVEQMLALLADGGRLMISTPLSPMSFEALWFDPLNHPPHHMTRWNIASYEVLARRFGLTVSFRMPVASALRYRVATAFNLRLNGPAHPESARRILMRALLRPHLLFAEFIRQQARFRVNGSVAADVILAEFRRSNTRN